MVSSFSRLICILGMLLAVSSGAEETVAPRRDAPSLLVVGVSKQFEDERWKDNRVGFGIRQLIAEELFGAGSYQMVEEKAAIRDKIREFAEFMWAMGADEDFEQRLVGFKRTVVADVVAWGTVESFSVPQQSVSIGPFHRVSEKTKVTVCVFLKDMRTGEAQSALGTGASRRSAKSVLFEFRKERKGEINFDKTAVGYATAEAVKNAVKSLKEKGLFR